MFMSYTQAFSLFNKTISVHPSECARVLALVHTVPSAYSSLDNMVGTSFVAASIFHVVHFPFLFLFILLLLILHQVTLSFCSTSRIINGTRCMQRVARKSAVTVIVCIGRLCPCFCGFTGVVNRTSYFIIRVVIIIISNRCILIGIGFIGGRRRGGSGSIRRAHKYSLHCRHGYRHSFCKSWT